MLACALPRGHDGLGILGDGTEEDGTVGPRQAARLCFGGVSERALLGRRGAGRKARLLAVAVDEQSSRDVAEYIRETAHTDLTALDYDYDFRVLESPNEVCRLIEERNAETGSARMVAGYCWDWLSKKDADAWDVVVPEHDFRMRWNLTQHGSGWLTHPDSISEIGCIHTCQGLELDYVGVIIGDDLVVRDGEVVTQPDKRSRHDRSIRGWKTWRRRDRERADAHARMIILNTYRTLMTRGLKGCYVWAVDEGVRAWLKRQA